jgi:TRAP-type C4-dicarboxylate transport system substrate-binding protein
VHKPLSEMLQKYGVELMYTQPTFELVVVCGGKHLKTVGDWPGTKVRAAGRWQSQQMLALGAAPTAIDPGEQYIALQNKTVDCALSVPNLVISLKLHEVAPKLTALRQAVNLSMLVMNPRTWRSISAADQETIRAVSTEARHRSITQMRAVADKGLADLKGLGSDIYSLSDGEVKAMKDKMKPVFDKIAEGAGEAGKPFAEVLKPYW